MTTQPTVPTAPVARPQFAPGARVGRRVRHWDRSTKVGLAVLVVVALAVVLAPVLSSHDPLKIDPLHRLNAPSWSHPFGTDELGRDIFARVLYGGRLTLVTALAAVFGGGAVGVSIGLVSGYFGRWTDAFLTRLMDFLLSVPAVLLAIVVIAVLGPKPVSALLAVGIVSIPQFARLARAGAISLKGREFVLAAISVGAGDGRILLRTILPNALGPIIVQAAITGATAILLEAALSFLGLGAQPPAASWGLMLSQAQAYLEQAPWYGLLPGAAVTVTVLALDLLAKGLDRQLARS